MPILSGNIQADGADGYDISGFNLHLTVAGGATITTDQSHAAIDMGTDGFDWAQNNGSLNGGIGVAMPGSQEDFWNSSSGEIFGYNGVSADGDNEMVINDGSIVATSWGVELSSADDSYVTNQGDITSAGIGLFVQNTNTLTIRNNGTIDGLQDSIEIVNGSGISIINSGTLGGNVSIASTGTTLVDRGLIDGNVTLGGGTNVFDGRGGQVTGTVTGGSGNDTLRAGTGDETLDGGAGLNTLYAGTGDDTFVYSAMGVADRTNIKGFNVHLDTIELLSSVFTKLTVGATPTFSIGPKPTGATDYLFYNKTTGGLYYDATPSNASKEVLLGTLSPGLHLTASDFAVA